MRMRGGLTSPGHLSSVTPNLHHSVLTDRPGLSLLSQVSPQDQPVLQTLLTCSSGQRGEAEPRGAMTLGCVSPGASCLCSVRGHRGHQAVGHIAGDRKGISHDQRTEQILSQCSKSLPLKPSWWEAVTVPGHSQNISGCTQDLHTALT